MADGRWQSGLKGEGLAGEQGLFTAWLGKLAR